VSQIKGVDTVTQTKCSGYYFERKFAAEKSNQVLQYFPATKFKLCELFRRKYLRKKKKQRKENYFILQPKKITN
jgi:hypothetical protein